MPHLPTIFLLTTEVPAIIIACLFVVLFCIPITFWAVLKLLEKKWNAKKQIFLMQVQHDNELMKAQIETQEQTFRNISAEVHDNVGQQLSLAHFHTERLSDQGIEAGHISTILRKAIADLRDLSHSLSAELIATEGLPAALQKDLAQLNRGNKIKAEFFVLGPPEVLSTGTATIIYRVFQEAVQNIIKHANADKVKVFLNAEEGHLYLGVLDNGVGIAPGTEDGQGFKNMKARLKAVGGTMTIDSDSSGTSLEFKTPLGL